MRKSSKSKGGAIWKLSKLFIQYAYYYIYRLFWPSDQVIDCLQIYYIQTLYYWYNVLDYSNFVYSYKMVCNSTKNKQKYAKLSMENILKHICVCLLGHLDI